MYPADNWAARFSNLNDPCLPTVEYVRFRVDYGPWYWLDAECTQRERTLWLVREGEEMPRPSYGPAIEDFLRRSRPAYHTAAEIAEAVGCTAQVVSRHLQSNLNVLSQPRESGARGRPATEYSLAIARGEIRRTIVSDAHTPRVPPTPEPEDGLDLDEFDPEAIEMELFGDLSFDWSEEDD